MQGQTMESDFVWHNLELSKFVGIVTDGMPPMIGSKNSTVCLLYKHMHKMGF
jgi:hypothetical protein